MLTYNTKFSDIAPNVTFLKPEQFDQNVLHIEVKYKGHHLGVQTPRLSFESVSDGCLRIFFEGKTPEKISSFYALYTQLENLMSKNISDTLRKYVTTDITTKDLFSSAIKPPTTLGQAPYIDVIVLGGEEGDKSSRVVPQNMDSFPSFGIGTFILALEHIEVTPTSAKTVWGVAQCLVHLPKTSLPPNKMSINEPVEKKPKKVNLEQLTIEMTSD